MEKKDIEDLVEHKVRLLDWFLVTIALLTLGIVFYNINELVSKVIVVITIVSMYITWGIKLIKFAKRKFNKIQHSKIPFEIIIPSVGSGFGIGVLFCVIWIELGL